NRFTPGVAYHFAGINLLDIYVGGAVPLGWDKYKAIDETTVKYGNGSASEEYYSNVTQKSGIFGVQAFIGLQAFVADLPFSIGLEYGLSAMFRTGLQYKHEMREGGSEQVYYTTEKNNGSRYDDLKMSKSEIGGDIRVTFTYYFK
ncbi:MAG: hypothetical protein LUC18_04925, partial [Porphyromonadaceae bacterium]|nr:hypothetical protein [Porphyromonadaceae bacterium]